MTYGFDVHEGWQLEAHSHGNLMRFANHTDEKFSNCHVRTLFSDEMTHHLCLFSLDKIEADTELVFDYG